MSLYRLLVFPTFTLLLYTIFFHFHFPKSYISKSLSPHIDENIPDIALNIPDIAPNIPNDINDAIDNSNFTEGTCRSYYIATVKDMFHKFKSRVRQKLSLESIEDLVNDNGFYMTGHTSSLFAIVNNSIYCRKNTLFIRDESFWPKRVKGIIKTLKSAIKFRSYPEKISIFMSNLADDPSNLNLDPIDFFDCEKCSWRRRKDVIYENTLNTQDNIINNTSHGSTFDTSNKLHLNTNTTKPTPSFSFPKITNNYFNKHDKYIQDFIQKIPILSWTAFIKNYAMPILPYAVTIRKMEKKTGECMNFSDFSEKWENRKHSLYFKGGLTGPRGFDHDNDEVTIRYKFFKEVMRLKREIKDTTHNINHNNIPYKIINSNFLNLSLIIPKNDCLKLSYLNETLYNLCRDPLYQSDRISEVEINKMYNSVKFVLNLRGAGGSERLAELLHSGALIFRNDRQDHFHAQFYDYLLGKYHWDKYFKSFSTFKEFWEELNNLYSENSREFMEIAYRSYNFGCNCLSKDFIYYPTGVMLDEISKITEETENTIDILRKKWVKVDSYREALEYCRVPKSVKHCCIGRECAC